MTGLRELDLNNSEDYLLVPHLLLLLQGHCPGLESLYISSYTGISITPEQLIKLASSCQQLHNLSIDIPSCASDAVLVELARSCPQLHKFRLLKSPELTEEGVLALAMYCRQLREIDLGRTKVTEETVRQLAQHCRRLTKLHVCVCEREGEVMVERKKDYSRSEIRALRETVRQCDRDIRNTDVITHHSNNTCCLIM